MFRRVTKLFSVPSLRRTALVGSALTLSVSVGANAFANPTSQQIINDAKNVVCEGIDGYIKANPQVARLDGFPDIKVLFRKDWDPADGQVALISGGGAGHEPAHAGYIGEGMLTAVVCGDVFASPSAEAVLAAIRKVGGPQGVVLIVKNYTGDRINFGLAAETAKAEGIPVEMVVVADDSALPKAKGITGGRGIAGTVFVHKLAGAAAAEGLGLAAVAATARAAAENVRSLGLSLSGCTLPGSAPVQDRVARGHVELGMGIHGEPGFSTMPSATADSFVDTMLTHITTSDPTMDGLPLRSGDHVAVLVNNLGSATTMELGVVTNRTVDNLLQRGVHVDVVYAGSYMTALDMKGFSISVLKLDSLQSKRRLMAPTTAGSWMTPAPGTAGPSVVPVPSAPVITKSNLQARLSATDGRILRHCVIAAAHALIAAEPDLTHWDAIVGDGDCGLTFKQGAERLLEEAHALPVHDAADTTQALARAVQVSMGGTSGALYNILLCAATAHLRHAPVTDAQALAKGLELGVASVQQYGGAQEGYRTMLDALCPASRVLSAALARGESLTCAVSQAAAAAEDGARATQNMESMAGRSNYVREELLRQVPDPGAMAVSIFFQAIAEELKKHH